MKTRINNVNLVIIALALSLLIVSIDIQNAYAIAGFQSFTTVNVTGGLSFDTCGGIATTPVSNYIIQQCVVAGGTTQTTVASFADGTLIDTATRTVATGDTANTDCWAITNTQAVCETGRLSPTQVVLIRATVTASDNISVSSFTLGGSDVIQGGINSVAGTSVYWGDSDGDFNRFSLSTFSQSGEWSGLQTGGCATLKIALAISGNIGLSICDTNEAYLFSFSGSSGSVTIEDSATLSGTFSGTSTKALYSSGWIYITDRATNEVQAIGANLNTIEFTTNVVEYPIFGNDIKGAGNYFLIIDGSSDQLYLIDKTQDAPNNIVVVQSFVTAIGEDGKLTTSDSSSFYWSKGTSGSTTVRYFLGTQLRNENDIPVVNTGTSGNSIDGVCQNGTVLDCVGANANAWSGFTSGQTALNMTAGITDGLGLTECGTTGDPETCGSGLFLFIFSLLLAEFLSLAGYLGFTTKMNAQKDVVDVALIMLIIAFSILALAFYLNWIPDVVFYSIVVLIAGFLTFGFMKHLRSG